jgi:hypothetical protein
MRGLFREFVAAKQRRMDEHDRDMALAWRVAALGRQKTLPKLDSLLSRKAPRQSAHEQRGILHILSAQYGIPLKQGRN